MIKENSSLVLTIEYFKFICFREYVGGLFKLNEVSSETIM
jgi:hypothetical protein